MPPGRTGHVTVAYENSIYFWGGYMEISNNISGTYLPPHQICVYCPFTERWQIKHCVATDDGGPKSMSGSTASVVGDHMYLYGGFSQDHPGTTNDLFRLSLKTYVWELLKPKGILPFSVDKTTSWTYDKKFYIFGGFGSPTSLMAVANGVFEFLVDRETMRGWTNQFYEYDPQENQWNIPNFRGTLPSPRAAHASALNGDKVYIFGGRRGSRRMNDIYCLDLRTMTWSDQLSASGPVPEGRSWHSLTTVCDTVLLLFGGFSNNDSALSDCWFFHTDTCLWEKVSIVENKPRVWHTATLTCFNEVMVYGGIDNSILSVGCKSTADILLLRVKPKSLLRLCLDRLMNLPELRPEWKTLPRSLQSLLNIRLNTFL